MSQTFSSSAPEKEKRVGTERAYQLEMYIQDANALYRKLSAHTNVVYLPAGWVPPSASPSPASQLQQSGPSSSWATQPQFPPLDPSQSSVSKLQQFSPT